MLQLIDISAKRKSFQGWYPCIRKHRTKQRFARRQDQEIIYINEPYLDYHKYNYGLYANHKHLFNEGCDYKRLINE
jgi:hypothetical protein